MRHVLILILFATAALSGCLTEDTDPGDEGKTGDPPGPDPTSENTQPDSVTGLDPIARLNYPGGDEPFPSAAGIWVFGDLVFGSALGNGFFIADVSDPGAPELLYNATTDADDERNNTITGFSRDADLVQHPDGRLSLVFATQSDGMHVWNVTDPRAPDFLARVEVDPNHNVAAVPGTTFVFNSPSGGADRSNDLVDLSDPLHPLVLGTYGDHGCHDISFFGKPGADRFRAYCAGIDRTEIWGLDGFDPDAPEFGIALLGTVEAEDSPVIANPALQAYPIRTLHHLAMVDGDADTLIIGDEQNGGGSPGACYFHDETTGLSTPLGALWFYDISDESDPQLLNWISAPLVQPEPEPEADPNYDPLQDVPSCTAHFGTLVPGEDKLVMAWYSAGVVLIEFTGVGPETPPRILDQIRPDPTNPWDARVHNGYVFTGDTARGMDVLRLV